MATITIPTTPNFKSLRAIEKNSSALSMSPYTFTQQVYVWAGQLKVVEFTLPLLDSTDGAAWVQFLRDLRGYENTFNLSTTVLSQAYPDETFAAPVAFRLADPEQSWNVRVPLDYELTFTAMEAK